MKRNHCSFLLMTMLMLSILSLYTATAETELRTYDIREIRIEGFNDSFISYPELIGGNSEIAEKVSTSIRQLADIDLFQRKMDHGAERMGFRITSHHKQLDVSGYLAYLETERGAILI